MAQRGNRIGLALKALDKLRFVDEVMLDDLDRYITLHAPIICAIDAGHATFTVAQLRAKPGDPDPPAVLTPGDVLLIVDPTWMVYSVTTVPLGAPNAN